MARPLFLVLEHPLTWLPLPLYLVRAAAEQALRRQGLAVPPFIPVTGSTAQAQKLARQLGPGTWLFSNYVWTDARNREISEAVRGLDARNVTLHGGPHVPKRAEALEAWLRDRADVSIAVRGEGELAVAELLTRLAEDPDASLADVAGVAWLDAGVGCVRTPDRPRVANLDELPSPYLAGHFDPLATRARQAVIETNRGCPYGCTFCDWGSLTQQKIKRFDLDRVKAEIEWCGRHGVERVFFADANFGIFDRDVEIAAHCVDVSRRHGFPRFVDANFAKNGTERLAEIVRLWKSFCSEGVISLQTLDPATLAAVDRANIRPANQIRLAEVFRAEGFPLATELILGLPGATVASFQSDLQFALDEDVTARIYPLELLPNSPMADPAYLARHAIEVDGSEVVATSSYTREDMRLMRRMMRVYVVSESLGLLRSLLRYVQWDRGVAMGDVVRVLAARPDTGALAWLGEEPEPRRRHLAALHERGPGAWDEVFAAIGDALHRKCGLALDGPLRAVLAASAFLPLWKGRTLPATLELAHDVVGYFSSRAAGEIVALAELGPGTLQVRDAPADAHGARAPGTIRAPARWVLPSGLDQARLATPPRVTAAAPLGGAGAGGGPPN